VTTHLPLQKLQQLDAWVQLQIRSGKRARKLLDQLSVDEVAGLVTVYGLEVRNSQNEYSTSVSDRRKALYREVYFNVQ
jgi:hypothetical protein